MELNADWFDDQTNEMGQDIQWRRAFMCPCRDTNSGSPSPSCANCGGVGWTWDTFILCRAGVASMRVAREFASFGTWESGDVILTLPSDSAVYAAGERDRVVMMNSSEPFSTTLTRGSQDRLKFPVLQVDRVFYLPTLESPLVLLPVPPVAADGTLLWADAPAAPPAGAQYSVTGRRHQEYYVFTDLPQDRAHFGGAPLPRRVQMRRFDLFGRSGG